MQMTTTKNKNPFRAPARQPLRERIIQATCIYFEIDEKELIEGLYLDIMNQKHLCWYLIREHANISHERIAERFGIRSHTTVLRAVEKIKSHRDIYARTLHDLKKIMSIADTLV